MFKIWFIACLVATKAWAIPLASDSTCLKKGKIRWHENNQLKEQTKGYCFNSHRHEIESLNCHKVDNCKAHQFKSVERDKLRSQYGSPGFTLCREFYFSVPKVIDFWDGKKWVRASICQFSDGHFIDLSRLEGYSR